MNRRTFIAGAATAVAGLPLMPTSLDAPAAFSISLAEWSLHRTLFRGDLHPLDFPVVARTQYDIDAVEYVNAFFLPSATFLAELKRRADSEGVRGLLIMVDDCGRLGDADTSLRTDAVDRHTPWLDAAHTLGCHSIRVNARSDGSAEEQMQRMADGLRRLAERADERGLNVLVENHGGYSSHGDWLAGLMKATDHPRAGTLPDFGNWYPADEYGGPTPVGKSAPPYDRYRGVEEMMPFARGLSAKSYDFDDAGQETSTDFARMIRIARDHGFAGHVGIEYEGGRLDEPDGIRATKRLLESLRF